MDAEPDMISVILCSINPGKFAAVSRNLADRMADAPFEIIGIHDARSLSEGYNRGIAQSSGDILIFCHDDIEIITPDFDARVRHHLETNDLVGCAGTSCLIDSNWIYAGDPFVHGIVAYPVGDAWPANRFDLMVWGGLNHATVPGIQALDGFFMATKRRVVDEIRFDEQTFDGFHLYDTDFTFAAHLAGYKVAVCKDILIAHKSGGSFGEAYAGYAATFMKKYKGLLAAQAHNSRKATVARNLDREQLLHLFNARIDPHA
jgi:GT2 family glycosyltransferase